jgi:DNA-binding HxlR family transcriptional regulator
MRTPLPGTPVRGSKTGRPIMALLDLLGRRMALRILWELSKANLKFRPLQVAAETNPSVLNARLGELKRAGIVGTGPEGYHLTETGRELVRYLLPLATWSDEWARKLERQDSGSSAGAKAQPAE